MNHSITLSHTSGQRILDETGSQLRCSGNEAVLAAVADLDDALHAVDLVQTMATELVRIRTAPGRHEISVGARARMDQLAAAAATAVAPHGLSLDDWRVVAEFVSFTRLVDASAAEMFRMHVVPSSTVRAVVDVMATVRMVLAQIPPAGPGEIL